MGTMTKDPNVLMKRWMEIYMNLSILNSSDAAVSEQLALMKGALAECNGYIMRFFDMIDADPEAAP